VCLGFTQTLSCAEGRAALRSAWVPYTVRRGGCFAEVAGHEGAEGLAPDYQDERRYDGLQEHSALLEDVQQREEDPCLRVVLLPGMLLIR